MQTTKLIKNTPYFFIFGVFVCMVFIVGPAKEKEAMNGKSVVGVINSVTRKKVFYEFDIDGVVHRGFFRKKLAKLYYTKGEKYLVSFDRENPQNSILRKEYPVLDSGRGYSCAKLLFINKPFFGDYLEFGYLIDGQKYVNYHSLCDTARVDFLMKTDSAVYYNGFPAFGYLRRGLVQPLSHIIESNKNSAN